MSLRAPFATITSAELLLIITTQSPPVFAFISASISPSSFIAFDRALSEFKVYGDSYIVFDEIPENVYAYNGASTVGDALIDAAEQKNYSNVAARIADAQIIVTDKKMKFNDTAIKVSKIVRKARSRRFPNPCRSSPRCRRSHLLRRAGRGLAFLHGTSARLLSAQPMRLRRGRCGASFCLVNL